MACQKMEHWVLLEDGEKSGNEARRMREHLTTCARCARRQQQAIEWIELWSAPAGELSREAATNNVLARLDERGSAAPRRAPRSGAFWARSRVVVGAKRFITPFRLAPGATVAWAGGALGAAALALAVARGIGGADSSSHSVGGEYAARGARADEASGARVSASLRRHVGLSFHLVHDMRQLRAGDAVQTGDAIVASFINLDAAQRVYALVFAVDGAGEVHWLYPAYLNQADNPGAVLLEPTAGGQVFMPEAVVIAAPKGRFSIFSITSYQQLRVNAIEALPAASLTRERLRGLLDDVQVSELSLRVD